jgi:hypothetical protein
MDAGTYRRQSMEPTSSSNYLSKVDYGRVPTYLHERNMELAAKYARQQVILPSNYDKSAPKHTVQTSAQLSSASVR